MAKKRILFISDSVKVMSGYSTVAKGIISNLVKTGKYDIAQLGFTDVPTPVGYPIDYYSQLKTHKDCCHKGLVIERVTHDSPEIKYLIPDIEPTGGMVYHPDQRPCIKGQCEMADHYGFDSVYFVIQDFKPDIVIPINDIWGLYNIGHLRNRVCYKFVPYLAIDSDCIFPNLLPPEGRPGLPPIDTVRSIGSMDRCIVFTNWAKEVIQKTCRSVTSGRELTNIEIIPHGVDTSIYKPLSNKEELRKKYFGIDDKTFLIISVARNQPRKRLDALCMTIKKFIERGYEKDRKIKCYFHCCLRDLQGWDLKWLTHYYGIADRIIFDEHLEPGIGPTPIQMNEIVNCADIQILLPNSEGWCSLPGANVLTTEGYKNIENITTNEKVITHTGKIRKVIQPLSREYSGEIIEIKSKSNGPSIKVTPNHNLYIYRDKRFQWVQAKDILLTDRTCFTIPKNTNKKSNILDLRDYIDYPYIVENDNIYTTIHNQFGPTKTKNPHSKKISKNLTLDAFMFEVIGNFLSEGCVTKSSIKFCLNSLGDKKIRQNVIDLAKRFDSHYNIRNDTRNRQVVTISFKILSSFFKTFGHTAKNKFIPGKIMEIALSNHLFIKSLINGLIEGDGSSFKDTYGNPIINFTSVSKRLCSQLRILLYSIDIHSSIYHSKRGEWSLVVQGKDNLKKLDFISKQIDNIYRKNTSCFIKVDSTYTYKIKSINKIDYKGLVYNLSVDQDESYVLDGISVHNCLPALESAAAGIPTLVTKYSAAADWGKDALLFCKVAEYEHEVRTGLLKAVPSTDDAVTQLRLIYQSKKMAEEYSKDGIRLGQKLEWTNASKQWETLIDSIDISDLKPDRYSDPAMIPTKSEQNEQMKLKYFPE